MHTLTHSASAKAGVLAMSKSLAIEWAERGVRVNCVAPGPFESDGAKQNLWPSDEVEERIRSSSPWPLRRVAKRWPAQVLWLCSDASRYVTGANITIDGGLSLGSGKMWEPGERFTRKSGQGGA